MRKKTPDLHKRFFGWIIAQFVVILLLLMLVGSILVQDGGYFLPFLCILLLAILQIYLGYRYLLRPYEKVNKIFRLFAEGYVIQDIFQLPYGIGPELQGVLEKFQEMLDAREMLNISKKQAEYLALQNQINPHFLYNTLEGIRSEALCAGVESVADMSEALATFFRYTISNMEHLVTVEDEIMNVENYCFIQQYRFGDRLELKIAYEDDDMEEILRCRISKLTLQPIVENAIRHGLEQKIGKGTVTIRFQLTEDRLLITISDDGMGMSKEQLDKINSKMRIANLEENEPEENKGEARGGIALVNVNNRIKLIFGDEYGLYFYSNPGIGTDVVITLPKMEEEGQV